MNVNRDIMGRNVKIPEYREDEAVEEGDQAHPRNRLDPSELDQSITADYPSSLDYSRVVSLLT